MQSTTIDCKVHIFWEGHKILQNLHRRFVWLALHRTNLRRRFRKILWPSQNISTLKALMNLHVHYFRLSGKFEKSWWNWWPVKFQMQLKKGFSPILIERLYTILLQLFWETKRKKRPPKDSSHVHFTTKKNIVRLNVNRHWFTNFSKLDNV